MSTPNPTVPALAQTALAFDQVGNGTTVPFSRLPTFAANGKLSSAPAEGVATTPNTWQTLINQTVVGPAACVNQIWLALEYDPTNTRIRITFDGASSPQIGGLLGIPVVDLFGAQGLAGTYTTKTFKVFRNDGQFGAILRMKMPFAASLKVEILTPLSGLSYCIVDYMDEQLTPAGPTYHFYVDNVVAPVGIGAEATILDISGNSVLLGLVHKFNGAAAANVLPFLEGDYRIYYGGSGTANYRSSGTEDFFNSGWYFVDGLVRDEFSGLLFLDYTNEAIVAYRLFPIPDAPAHSSRLKLTWTNGDPGGGLPPGVTDYRLTRFVLRDAAPTTTPSTPNNFATTVITSAAVRLTWSAGSEAATAGYRVTRNATQVYDGQLASFTDAGRAASTAYTYAVTAYDRDGTATPSASLSATTLATTSGLHCDGSGWAYTPSATSLDVAGDMDVRIFVTPVKWSGGANATLASRYGVWLLELEPAGTITVYIWGTGGAVGHGFNAPGFADGTPKWIRWTLQASSGGGNHAVALYFSDDGVVWTLFNTVFQAPPFPMTAGTGAALVIGQDISTHNGFVGHIGEFQLRTAVNGSLITNPIFTAHVGQTSFTDAQGFTYTLFGTAVIG